MLTFYKNKIKNIDVLVQVEDAVVIFFLLEPFDMLDFFIQ